MIDPVRPTMLTIDLLAVPPIIVGWQNGVHQAIHSNR